jgi:uracil-DNA glycosylase
MDREQQIQKLNQEIKNCKKCSLWKTRKNTVPMIR